MEPTMSESFGSTGLRKLSVDGRWGLCCNCYFNDGFKVGIFYANHSSRD